MSDAPFQKVLIANRGEIAVRAIRAARELGCRTVAVYTHEDRFSAHRTLADAAYRIGVEGRPVEAHLDADAIIEVAVGSGADAVYPGYGFLAENAELARLCTTRGLTFVGPNPDTLELAGDKAQSLAAARRAEVPTLESTSASTDIDELVAMSRSLTYPVFVKAIAGGGGRGMRRVGDPEALRSAIQTCMREAEAAFGDGAVLLEKALTRPRHVEVQILADRLGHVVHLFDRDCSVQRRHQKIIEIAPAPGLATELRHRLCNDAVRLAESIGYTNAGTVEFLVDERGRHAFIEINPRVQVEHTVTEEVTGVDMVRSQLEIAAGATLDELGLKQETLAVRGAAIQCRVTSEDPANGFQPSSGTITDYALPGGPGVRVDDGPAGLGATISPRFDALVAKVTCTAADHARAIERARGALSEMRIGGIATNLPFLLRVLGDEQFQAAAVTTAYLDDRPDLTAETAGVDTVSGALAWLVHTTATLPHGPRPELPDPATKAPPAPVHALPMRGSRDELLELGPVALAESLRRQTAVAVTETTFRDAHQSLLATRVRTRDLVEGAELVSRMTPELWSLECWGGATYDVALRFLAEDPWERLERLREAVPNICLQMLLRGRNTVGYTPYPESVTRAFVGEAHRTGIDVFRIFDALNNIDPMRPAIDAVLDTGAAVAEVAMCYTGNLLDPGERTYNLDYYLRLADSIVDSGAHVLGIKDMAGLLRPAAAAALVAALRSRFDLPVHLHTHDTAGAQVATLLAAIDAGVDAVDAATAPLAGTTSQPSLSALVAATDGTARETGLSLEAVCALEPFWAAIREAYAPFETGLPAPTGRVYAHEIPGGQLTNLRQQALALGLGDRFEEIEAMYASANRILGNPVKVTPSSKVVGDLALHLVGTGTDPREFERRPAEFDMPDSVIGFLGGELGEPAGGWPEPFRSRALQGRPPRDSDRELPGVAADGLRQRPRETLNQLLFPGPAATFGDMRARYGDISGLSTPAFLYGLGSGDEEVLVDGDRSVVMSIDSVSEPDPQGIRTALCRVDGRVRLVQVGTAGPTQQAAREVADDSEPGHVGAPYAGIVSPKVQVGEVVAAGDVVALIEAMKMEAAITSPVDGTVERILCAAGDPVDGGDLLVVVNPPMVSLTHNPPDTRWSESTTARRHNSRTMKP